MYVVVGLGNPGKQYENTRHNVGFNVIDILAKEYDISVTKIKHKALIGEGRIGSEKVLLVKPQTYMNLSGETLIDIYKYYKVDLDNIIVIYDDIDLDVGKLRIRRIILLSTMLLLQRIHHFQIIFLTFCYLLMIFYIELALLTYNMQLR